MNKFLVFPCVKQEDEENGYNGHVVSLACTANMSFVLFFPISDNNSHIINFILNEKLMNNSIDFQLIGVYQTMLDSWKAGDRFLSGIVMDTVYDETAEEDIIAPTLIISDSSGNVDTVLNVNFVHAIILAAIERKEILVTNELLDRLLPQLDEDGEEIVEDGETEEKTNFPVDKQILDIAKDIMGGKRKSDDKDDTNNTNDTNKSNKKKPKDK